MAGGSIWWMAAAVVLASSLVACVAALGDSAGQRLRTRRGRSPAELAAAAVPASGFPATPAPAAGPVSPAMAPVSPPAAPPPLPVAAPPLPPAPPVPPLLTPPVPGAPPLPPPPPVPPAPAVIAAPGVASPPTSARPISLPPPPAVPVPVPRAAGPEPAGGVEVRLLGPLDVEAPGRADRVYFAELVTLVTMAAMMPGGIPLPVIGELLPRPGALAAVSRHIRDWLGLDATGLPRLGERGGAWRLSPDVRVDWHTFHALVSTGEPAEAPHRRAAALALIRGELLSGVPLPPVALRALQPYLNDIRLVVANVVRRDITFARSADDPARTEWAVRQGLTLLPHDESLRQLQPRR